jgi:uncharacterized protein (DUF58 family)
MKKLSLNEIRKFGNLEMLAKQFVEGFITGMHKSPYHGFSVEFSEHRLYNSGESTRHIDWKVFSRTDKLFVKTFEEETNLRCMLVIDQSSSMYYPKEDYGKLVFSVMSAAAIAYMLHKQRDAVGLTAFGDEITLQTQIKSTSTHLHQLFAQMQSLLDQSPKMMQTDVAKILHQIADQVHKRSLVVIFSDMMDKQGRLDEIFAALQHLKHNRHEVLIFHVKDAETEEFFNFDEKPLMVEDLETGETLKIQPSQVREIYRKKIAQINEEIKLKCGQYKVHFVEADIKSGFEFVLQQYLMKRAKMR